MTWVEDGVKLAIQDPSQYPKLLQSLAKQPGGSQFLQYAPDPNDPDLKQKLQNILPVFVDTKDFQKVSQQSYRDYLNGDLELSAVRKLSAADTPQKRQMVESELKGAGLSDYSQQYPDAASAKQAFDALVAQKQAEKPGTEKGGQAKEGIYKGKRTFGVFDPNTNTFNVDGKQVSAQEFRPIAAQAAGGAGGGAPSNPKVWDTTGEDMLKMIPPQWRSTVKKIGDYDEDPTKVLAARGGQRAMVMQWVNQYNPNYKQDEFAVRSPTRKAFTTGTQGQQINAMNTAIGHIDQLTTLVDRLGNGAFVPGNQVWNTVQTMFGSDKVTNFDTLKDALSGEVASILSKNGATVSGIADAKAKINGASSPAQLAGYIKTQIPIMGSKLASLDYQYKQAMGDDKFSALSPDSKRILQKYGFDPSHPTLEGGSGPKQQPIPGVPGGVAELRNGRWIRVK
jgi:hypothetical protein